MKCNRIGLLSIVAIALLAGCGKSTSLTDVPTTPTPTLDTTAPPALMGLVATENAMTGGQVLQWSPSSAPDVARYQIYKFSPDPTRMDSYVPFDEVPASTTRLPLLETASTTTEYYCVRAIDQAGNSGPLSTVLAIEVHPVPVSGGGSNPDPGRPPVGRTEL